MRIVFTGSTTVLCIMAILSSEAELASAVTLFALKTDSKKLSNSDPLLAQAQVEAEVEMLGALMGAGPPPPPPKPDGKITQDTSTINLIENERNMTLLPGYE